MALEREALRNLLDEAENKLRLALYLQEIAGKGKEVVLEKETERERLRLQIDTSPLRDVKGKAEKAVIRDYNRVRSADSKFARMHREFSGTISQGKVQVSTIDGHVYGSVQKVGRSLEEYAHDQGMGRVGQLIGKGKEYKPLPVPDKRDKPSPFKRRWQESSFIVEKKGR